MRVHSVSKDELRRPIAEHIKKLRVEHLNETQAEFARRLGLNQVTVARYETGAVPKLAILRGLAELSDEHGYQAGTIAFRGAAGKRQQPEAHPHLEEIIRELSAVLGAWGYLEEHIVSSDDPEMVHQQKSTVKHGLFEAIRKLRALTIRGAE